MDVSIIIVNYNTTEHLKKCLEAIINYTDKILYEIIVVDNNSPERDIENLAESFSSVNFIFSSTNTGFGGGCNYGASKAKGKYLCFVNPDIIINDNVFFVFFNYMNENPDTSLCTGLQIGEAGELQYSYNNFQDVKWEFKMSFNIGLNNAFKALLEKDEIKNGKIFEIDWALGALIFMRKEVFENVNGFDNDYFLYYEDNDLQFRIKKLGGKIVCLPFVRVFHYGQSSINEFDGIDFYNYNMHRSKIIYMYKHFGFISRNIVRMFYITSYFLRIFFLPLYIKERNSKFNLFKRILATIFIYFKTRNYFIND
jgi:GT2 family glycosyltransferase